MIKKIKSQNKKYKAFTLIEMLVVLIVMWIMLMVTLFLSGDQIQKVRNKTVKESILAEMQSRYSRNLWSSSFAWTMYDHMDVEIKWWSNEFLFSYYTWDSDVPFLTNSLIDSFKIKYITFNYKYEESVNLEQSELVKLKYTPYQISCEIGDENGSDNQNVVIVTNVNDSQDYCFEISKQNCRLIELSPEKCKDLKEKAHLY